MAHLNVSYKGEKFGMRVTAMDLPGGLHTATVTMTCSRGHPEQMSIHNRIAADLELIAALLRHAEDKKESE